MNGTNHEAAHYTALAHTHICASVLCCVLTASNAVCTDVSHKPASNSWFPWTVEIVHIRALL